MTLVDFLFFIEVLVGGFLTGIMYSLVAIGLVLIFKASSIFNFAQGALVLFGALTFVLLTELGGDFWAWTGWLAVGLAAAAGVIFMINRMKLDTAKAREFSDKYVGRMPIYIAAVLLVVLALFVDGGQNMWRGVFVTLLIFLMLTTAVRSPKWAVGVLLGLAIVAFFGDGVVNFRALAVSLVIVIGLAIAIERIVLRPMVNQEPIILFMATIGLNYVIEGIAQGVWDADVHALDIGIPDVPFELYGSLPEPVRSFCGTDRSVAGDGTRHLFPENTGWPGTARGCRRSSGGIECRDSAEEHLGGGLGGSRHRRTGRRTDVGFKTRCAVQYRTAGFQGIAGDHHRRIHLDSGRHHRWTDSRCDREGI